MDVREIIFENVKNETVKAEIKADNKGLIAGADGIKEKLENLDLELSHFVKDGEEVEKGDVVVSFTAKPTVVMEVKEIIISTLSKPSGAAFKAYEASLEASSRVKITSSAWEKMPIEVKDRFKNAIETGGISSTISKKPYVWVDNSLVKIFDGIYPALKSVTPLKEKGYQIVFQTTGEIKEIYEEVKEASEGGADILMVDTGSVEDAIKVIYCLNELNMRCHKKVGFSGSINIKDISKYASYGIDILDIKDKIIDSPPLDLKMEIIK
ncbi:hypothetical protein [Natranaerofaba carboxydovora]|uniref:hypothetical protein n=1 Tax=Natranaerofaba carboxydovora TaxID=2742683 RepID=UPI001F1349F9|nr:hypothetical protein [Natranaerofaba carboxydovora]UMZ74780.1 putative nicotinate-nucleotide pyrophosphorylase [carboxylating] [Natranaerofaba carboxydovora]